MSKRYPPFGHSILKNPSIKAETTFIYLFTGLRAWELAKKWQPYALCLPPWVDPATYQWPVMGLRIAIFDTGWAEEDYISDLVIELYRNGATHVQVMSPDYECTTFDV